SFFHTSPTSKTYTLSLHDALPILISSQEIADNGQTEVNQILATLAPSFNASHQTIGDGSDHIDPASLRGLGPDQVLVLVNGKRRSEEHTSELQSLAYLVCRLLLEK